MQLNTWSLNKRLIRVNPMGQRTHLKVKQTQKGGRRRGYITQANTSLRKDRTLRQLRSYAFPFLVVVEAVQQQPWQGIAVLFQAGPQYSSCCSLLCCIGIDGVGNSSKTELTKQQPPEDRRAPESRVNHQPIALQFSSLERRFGTLFY